MLLLALFERLFGARVVVDDEGVTDGHRRFPFAETIDAELDRGVLVLVSKSGRRDFLRPPRGDAFAVLEAVLDGLARAHPSRRSPGAPYRAADARGTSSSPKSRLRRRGIAAGGPDLLVGRTWN